VEAGWPAAHVGEQLGISRATAYKWIRRHREDGIAGLEDRSSRPRRSPRRLSPTVEADILATRASWRYGPDRLGPLLNRPPSTIHRVPVRRGLSRLRDADRVTTAPIRYVACHPRALIHQDHKKLGRIPDGGGWRALARDGTRDHQRAQVGYEHLEVVVDDASRLAVVVPVPDDSAASAAHALEVAASEFATVGITIERVLTDNGWAYTRSAAYRAVLVPRRRGGPTSRVAVSARTGAAGKLASLKASDPLSQSACQAPAPRGPHALRQRRCVPTVVA
jgi:hypothetical protein